MPTRYCRFAKVDLPFHFPDRTPPSLRFTDQNNPLSKETTETFTWSADETVTFKCKVDEREETDCGQGTDGEFTTPNLSDGEHVFQVLLLHSYHG
jgi:hypothetical protein